jgi:endonuclease/exonuclease/phosphatase family metal-dependent hydrolase
MEQTLKLHPLNRLIAIFRNLKLLKAVFRIGLVTLDLYAFSVIAYFILRPITGDNFILVFVYSNIVGWALFPALILLPVFLLTRQWPRASLYAIQLVAVGLTFGTMFLPGRVNAAPDGSITLTVLTYNSANWAAHPDDLVRMLRESDADIIGLQELGPDQAEAVESELLDVYPYQVLNPGFITGKGLLSRFPVTDYEVFDIASNRPYIEASLDVEGQSLRVFVAHPPAPGLTGRWNTIGHVPGHAIEIQAVLDRADINQPTLLIGDFNVTDQGDNYRLLTDAGYTDVYHEVGWGLGATYPARIFPFPMWRIDYVWTSPHFLPLNSHIGEDAGSDHLPVVAQVAWMTSAR